MMLDDITRRDPKGMSIWISDFPKQIEQAVHIGKEAKIKLNMKGIQNIVLTGLGGSAIGDDLLRSYFAEEVKVPFRINQSYVLPEFVGQNTFVIVYSYSGNAEETISAHKNAIKRKARVLCISTGGEMAENSSSYRECAIKIGGTNQR
jgi:glucose/mannose-6-phosphate isomerase